MHHFFAYLSRMKHINRWGLMRNVDPENDAEHTTQVAFIAHALCTIAVVRYGAQIDSGYVSELALFHDVGEVLTGDLATPIKYSNPDIQRAYKEIERTAAMRLIRLLPDDLKGPYESLLKPDESSYEWKLVKAADRISAYVKCLEELKMGNDEFSKASQSIASDIEKIDLPEVKDFMREFVPSFSLTLDELNT